MNGSTFVIDDTPVGGRDGSNVPAPTDAVRVVPRRLLRDPPEVRGIDEASVGGRIRVDDMGIRGSPARADEVGIVPRPTITG